MNSQVGGASQPQPLSDSASEVRGPASHPRPCHGLVRSLRSFYAPAAAVRCTVRRTAAEDGFSATTAATSRDGTVPRFIPLVRGAMHACSRASCSRMRSITSCRSWCLAARCRPHCGIAFALPADQLHRIRARPRRSSVWLPSLIEPGDSSSTGSTTGRRSASDATSSMSSSVGLRTRLRQARPTWSGANPSCSISRPHGRRLTRASGSALSPASSSISKPRLYQRVRCEWSPFRARLGDRFLRAWYWSGRRASNPLPRPWQGRALPSELLPLGQSLDFTRPSPVANHGSTGARQGMTRFPHRSRSASTRIAEAWSCAHDSLPESTAALTAAIADAS
jgi:hypothetical protein